MHPIMLMDAKCAGLFQANEVCKKVSTFGDLPDDESKWDGGVLVCTAISQLLFSEILGLKSVDEFSKFHSSRRLSDSAFAQECSSNETSSNRRVRIRLKCAAFETRARTA